MFKEFCIQFERGRRYNREMICFTKEELHMIINIKKSSTSLETEKAKWGKRRRGEGRGKSD